MGKIVSLEEMEAIRNGLRREGKKVVFTNGCFDIIHRGHVEYLQQAKELGDVLVVGVNTDSSLSRIKGEKRPLVKQDDRAFIVANLAPVDYVCLFDENTPLRLISALVPDVLVKGGDWDVDQIVGKEIVEKAGGKVATLDFVPHYSTTAIIERILERYR